MNHTILAPNHWAAQRLTVALKSRGHVARHTQYGKHHVVLAIAPLAEVNRACIREQFVPGLKVGFNAR